MSETIEQLTKELDQVRQQYYSECERVTRLKAQIRDLQNRPFSPFSTETLADELESRGYELTMKRGGKADRKRTSQGLAVGEDRGHSISVSSGRSSSRGLLPGEASIISGA